MIRPLRDYVLVQIENTHTTRAGLVLASARGMRDSQAQYGHRGVVLAVGPGTTTRKGKFKPTVVKVGDSVRFGEFQLKETDEPGHVLIQEADITGIEHGD